MAYSKPAHPVGCSGTSLHQKPPRRPPNGSQLSLVLQALSDFHYNALELGIQYEDDTLKLTAKLEGKNPDWQQGRPVNFNLTVQENIPALLKSLRSYRALSNRSKSGCSGANCT